MDSDPQSIPELSEAAGAQDESSLAAAGSALVDITPDLVIKVAALVYAQMRRDLRLEQERARLFSPNRQ